MSGLSTLPAGRAVAALGSGQRGFLLDLFTRMRSGRGFRNDLGQAVVPAGRVTQPTLVIASRHDGGVPFRHAEALVDAIPRARLLESRASSHILWLGADWPRHAEEIIDFIRT